mmetsp:Transcript_17562/g.21453  ORF Transcript_17562/g.21453 Transcript_17562/m.21453 type:complete len:683 (+) Transcript_17562:151-2199(+)
MDHQSPLFVSKLKSCLATTSESSAGSSVPGLVDSSRDPYFDENSSHSSTFGTGFLRSMSSPVLSENIMRRIERDPYEVYEEAKMLGTGSMGAVVMVKKRDSVVGGTARLHNLSTRKRLELKGVNPMLVTACTLPVVGNFVLSCTGIDESDINQVTDGNFGLHISNSQSQLNLSCHHTLNLSRQPINLDDTMHSPNHVRINKYLEKERKKGKYEAYYALKSIHLNRVHDLLFINELKNEIQIMKTLDHAHIAKLVETYENKGQLYMVLELCSGGDLYSRDPYTEDQAARIINNILSAVAFMHRHDIMHRDLKYENIMFANQSPNAEVKIIDFGLSKKYMPSQILKDSVGTVYTMSPEILDGDYTNKADVWAVGVLSYMLLSSQMPFYGRKRREILDKIARCNYDFKGRRWSLVSQSAKNFVSDLLIHDPDARPTAEEARKCFWLNSRSSSVRTATEDDMDAVAHCFEHYAAHLTLQKLALVVIAHKSNSEEIGYLRNVFKRYDKDRHGEITLPEFRQCLEKYNYSDDYVETLFNAADLNGSGKLKYTEFLAATIESTELVTEERLAEAFDQLDCDDTGYISVENIRDLLGESVPEKYIKQVIAEADLRNDNKVTYDEFLYMWRQDIEDRNIAVLRTISAKRTVTNLVEEMIDDTSGDEEEYEPTQDRRLGRIAELDDGKKSFS